MTSKILLETFERKMILFSGKAKMRTKREFTGVNDRLSTFLTQHGDKRAFVQRFLLMSLICLGLLACGQTGPLYMPDETPPIYVPPEEE